MNEILSYSLIGIGLLVIFFLTRFILDQWKNLAAIQQHRSQEAQRQSTQRASAIESIHVLARCLVDKQVDLSEGCIRIRVLLDHVAPELLESPTFQVFHEIYAGLEHMPTHEARKQTDKRFVHKMDMQRFKLERENEDRILEAARKLLDEPALKLH